MRVAALTQSPWRSVYYEWPAALVLAMAVVLLEQDRDAAQRAERDRRTLALYVNFAFHEPKRLGELPPIETPSAAERAADVADAAARLAAAPPVLPEA